MKGFVFIYILLIIFFIIGFVIIWRLKKKIFQIIAEDPEKLVHLSFYYASKLGIKTTVVGIKILGVNNWKEDSKFLNYRTTTLW